jgi:hypothetical protein
MKIDKKKGRLPDKQSATFFVRSKHKSSKYQSSEHGRPLKNERFP